MITQLLRLLGRHKLRTALTLFLMFVASLLNGISLAFLSPILKVLFEGSRTSAILPEPNVQGPWRFLVEWVTQIPPMVAVQRLALAIVVLFLLKFLVTYLQRLTSVTLEETIVKDLRDHLYEKVLHMPLPQIESHSTGEWLSRFLSDVNQIKGAITHGLFVMLREGLNGLAYLSIALIASWRLTIFALFVVPTFAYLIAAIGRKIRKRSMRVQHRMARIGKHLAETLEGVKLVKGFAMEPEETKRFQSLTKSFYRSVLRRAYVSVLAAPLTEFLSAVAAAVILLYGGHLILVQHALSPDRFLVFLASALSLMSPLKRISSGNTALQQGLGAGRRVFDLLATAEREPSGTRPFQGLQREIVFDHVSFSYSPQTPALRDVSFRIQKGEKVALVGPSGSGKTTIADLLLGFYRPTQGHIWVDGVDLFDYDLRSYRQRIAFVPQETILFSGTVFENIAYAKPDAGRSAVEKAAAIAHADEFIQRLPEGMETDLGERANALSGGEKQRIALARAILRDPDLIILDEVTSALDSHTEALIHQVLWDLLKGKTAVIIAHRLQTVLHADRIIVLHQGRVVCVGRHEELLETCPLYRTLYQEQFAKPQSAA